MAAKKLTFIESNNNPRLALEIPIDVLETPARRLWVEEVRDRDERKADRCPDDPEFPA